AVSAQLIPPCRVLDNGGCWQRRRGRDRNRRRLRIVDGGGRIDRGRVDASHRRGRNGGEEGVSEPEEGGTEEEPRDHGTGRPEPPGIERPGKDARRGLREDRRGEDAEWREWAGDERMRVNERRSHEDLRCGMNDHGSVWSGDDHPATSRSAPGQGRTRREGKPYGDQNQNKEMSNLHRRPNGPRVTVDPSVAQFGLASSRIATLSDLSDVNHAKN